MNEANSLIESMNSWGFAVNARIAFNKFIKAIEKENGVTDENIFQRDLKMYD